MNVYILDRSINTIAIIDQFTSMIWTDRYNGYGDFELYFPYNPDLMQYIKHNYYVQIDESEHTMIIEDIKMTSDVEEGRFVTVAGRSLESILERRVIIGERTYSDTIPHIIYCLLNENIVFPLNIFRKIPNFIYYITLDLDLVISFTKVQYNCDTLYEAIQGLCNRAGCGFKIIFNNERKHLKEDFDSIFEGVIGDSIDKLMIFKLYQGEDRSYEQLKNEYVIFSPEFNNIINTNYQCSLSNYKNVAIIGGEGEGRDRKVYSSGIGAGLTRREMYVDASSISSKISGRITLSDIVEGIATLLKITIPDALKEKLPDLDYWAILKERGYKELRKTKPLFVFEGNAYKSDTYEYGVDYFLGDIVEVEDEFGNRESVLINEIIFKEDESGYEMYPSFESVKEYEDSDSEDEYVEQEEDPPPETLIGQIESTVSKIGDVVSDLTEKVRNILERLGM